MEKIEMIPKAGTMVKDDGSIVAFFTRDEEVFEEFAEQKVKDMTLLVSGELLVVTGPLSPIMGVCEDAVGLAALKQAKTTRVKLILFEGEDSDRRLAVTLPVQVSLA